MIAREGNTLALTRAWSTSLAGIGRHRTARASEQSAPSFQQARKRVVYQAQEAQSGLHLH